MQDNVDLKDIGVAEINLALQNLLEEQIYITDLLGKTIPVCVYFRERDSKKIPDATARGMITVSWTGEEKPGPGYQGPLCATLLVTRRDEEGNPLEYQEIRSPEILWYTYTISARAEHWDDIIAIQSTLSKFFPMSHSAINVDGLIREMRRDGLSTVDDPELGVFIRDYSIKILGRSFGMDCKRDKKFVPIIKTAGLEVCTEVDPLCIPAETIEILD